MAILDAEVAKLTEEEEDGEEERKDKAFAAAVAVVSPIPPPSPFKGGEEEDEEEEEESLEEVTISTSDDDPLSAALAMAEELGHTAQAAAAATSRGGGGGGGDKCPVNTTTTTTTSLPLVDLNQEYHLKWIRWKGALKLPVVTQNANGPCPLLAIINVLLLRKNIEFPPMIEIITAAQLMEYLCDFLLNNVPTVGDRECLLLFCLEVFFLTFLPPLFPTEPTRKRQARL